MRASRSSSWFFSIMMAASIERTQAEELYRIAQLCSVKGDPGQLGFRVVDILGQ